MALASRTVPRPWQAGRLPPVPPRRLLLIWLALFALLGGMLWWLFGRGQAPPNYQTTAISRGTISVTIGASGLIANPTAVPLTFRSSGRLAHLNVSVGDQVVAGQELARLDTYDLATTLEQERAKLANLQAVEAEKRVGKTAEQEGQAAAILAAAQTDYQNALHSLAATQETAAAAVASAQEAVESARVDLRNAQRSLENAHEQLTANLAAETQAVDNARSSYAAAGKVFETAFEQAEKANAANATAVQNAQQSLAAALENLAAVEAQAAQTLNADRLSVDNAKASLADAQKQLTEQKRVSESNITVAERQLQQARTDLKTLQAQRRDACNGATTTASCNVAKRQEDAGEAGVRTAESQLTQTRAQAQQLVVNSGGQVTTAQNSLRAAEATMNTNVANSRQSSANARNSVTTAQNTLKSAQATLESGKAQNANALASSKSSLDSALSSLLAAEKTLDKTRAAQNGSVVTAENTVDQNRAALARAEKSAESTRAQQDGNIQTARNTVDQQASNLEKARADYAQSVAGSTPEQLEQARANTDAQQRAVDLATHNLVGGILVAPSSGTVASITNAVGEWVSGGSSGSSSSESSSSSASSSGISSVGAVKTTEGFITLTDLTQPQVSPQVSEADIGRVRLGQRVSFTVSAYPDRVFTGTVLAIQPVGQIVSNVVTYNVVCAIDPTDVQLLPTMTANVLIVVDEQADILLAPNAAISYARDQATTGQTATVATPPPTPTGGTAARESVATVLVLRNGQAVPQTIQIGASDDVNTQVLSGLESGDQVVIGAAVAP